MRVWRFPKTALLSGQKHLYLIYTLLFGGIWGLWLLPFLLRGNGHIALGDGFNQYYPAFVYIGDYIRNTLTAFFSDGIKQFDLRIGLGDDIFATLNYYGFGDILSALSALVPLRYTELAFSGILLLRYYLCGIAFIIYCRRYIKSPYLRIAGGLMYAGCIFGLLFGMRFFMFLTPMITLPLILRGVDDLIDQDREKKNLSKWLIGGLFIQALNEFYFLYMQIIVVIIYFFVVTIIRHRLKFYTYILPMVIHGLLGIGLGGYILLPAIFGVFNSDRLPEGLFFDSFSKLFIFHDVQYYLTKLAHLIVPEAYQTPTTLPLIMLIGIIFLSGNVKKYKEFSRLFAITGILFLVPLMGSVMNGFSVATDRWYYVVLLFGTIGTLLALQEDGWFIGRKKLGFYLIAFSSLGFNLIISNRTIGTFLRLVVYLSLICLLPYLLKPRKNRERWLLAYITVTVAATGFFLFAPRVVGGSGFSAEFKAYGETPAEMAASIASIPDTDGSFARWDAYASSRGTALVMDYYGTTEYFSVMNGYVIEFFRSLFISPGIPGGSFDIRGLDGRIELESLLSVTDYMDFVATDNTITPLMLPNDMALPLGFTYNRWISRDQFERLNPLEKMSALTANAVIDGSSPPFPMNTDHRSPQNVPLNIMVEYYNIDRSADYFFTGLISDRTNGSTSDRANYGINSGINPDDHESKIRVWLTEHTWYDDLINKKGELYVKLEGLALHSAEWLDLSVGNKTLQLRNSLTDFSNYAVQPATFWVNITELQFDGKAYYFDIDSFGENRFSLGDIAVFYHPIDQTALAARSSNPFADLTIETNQISGRRISAEPELLFLSVPFSSGWSATVDGEKVPVYRTNIAFISVFLEPGRHDICFTYQTPGLKIGLGWSICSLLGLVIWVVIANKYPANGVPPKPL